MKKLSIPEKIFLLDKVIKKLSEGRADCICHCVESIMIENNKYVTNSYGETLKFYLPEVFNGLHEITSDPELRKRFKVLKKSPKSEFYIYGPEHCGFVWEPGYSVTHKYRIEFLKCIRAMLIIKLDKILSRL